MNNTLDGRPTGQLNSDCTMMEVHCFVRDGENVTHAGKRWVPITKEQHAQITSQNTGVVSMSAVVATTEMMDKLHTDELSPPGVHLEAPRTVVGFIGQDADEVVAAALAARAVKPGMDLPDGITLTPPPPYTMLSSLSEALGEETTPEEEEQWATIRTDMREKSAKVEAAIEEEVEKTEADEVPQRRSTDIKEPENTGFNVNYYSVHITHPKRPERAPYIFEVDDLIGALNLTFNEGTVLKSLVRSANEREHGLAKQGNDALRDAQKMVHSSSEHLRILTLGRLK